MTEELAVAGFRDKNYVFKKFVMLMLMLMLF